MTMTMIDFGGFLLEVISSRGSFFQRQFLLQAEETSCFEMVRDSVRDREDASKSNQLMLRDTGRVRSIIDHEDRS